MLCIRSRSLGAFGMSTFGPPRLGLRLPPIKLKL